MKEVRKTSQFKKDFKRFSKDLEKVKTVQTVLFVVFCCFPSSRFVSRIACVPAKRCKILYLLF